MTESEGGGATANPSRGLVIAWMPVCPRCSSLGRDLGFDVVLLGRRGFRRPWTALLTYPRLVLGSVREIRRRRPSAVVVIAPPVIAPLVILPAARTVGAKVAIDVHSGALLDRRWRWSVPLLRLLAWRSSASIVTLDSLVERLGRPARRVIVMPDPLPEIAPREGQSPPPREGTTPPLVVCVAGWGSDEPLAEVGAAATGQSWQLAISGKPKWDVSLPANATLTGFLGEAEYGSMLDAADVVLALTTRQETLLAGAWEGIARGRALVLSDTPALRSTFGEAAVYVAPDRRSIAAGVNQALERRGELEARAAKFAAEYRRSTRHRLDRLAEIIRADRPRR
jgi:glycosyltransferase involved in cell wall biosynthesis